MSRKCNKCNKDFEFLFKNFKYHLPFGNYIQEILKILKFNKEEEGCHKTSNYP